jgi:serine/threonine protein kinase
MSEELQNKLADYVAKKRFREFIPTLVSVELIEYVTEEEFHLEERVFIPEKFERFSQLRRYAPEGEKKAWLAQVIADIGITTHFYLHGHGWAHLHIKSYQQMIDEFYYLKKMNASLFLNAEQNKALWLMDSEHYWCAYYRSF